MERRADRRPRLPALDGMSWAMVDVSNFYVSAERLFDPSLSPRSTSCARRWRGALRERPKRYERKGWRRAN